MSLSMVISQADFAQEAKKQQSDNTESDTVYLSKNLIQDNDSRKHILHVDLKNSPINWAWDLLRKVPELFMDNMLAAERLKNFYSWF